MSEFDVKERDAIEQRFQSGEKQITEIRKDFHEFRSEVLTAMSTLSDKIGNMARPDFRAMWAGTAVMVSLVFGMFALAGFVVNSIDVKQTAAVKELDDKLQRETRLTVESVQRDIVSVGKISDAAHEGLQKQIDNNHEFLMLFIKRELEEARDLRARERRKGSD